MTLNRVKLGCAVTFVKDLAGIVSLIFLSKTLIWNKITFPTSDSLILVELIENVEKNVENHQKIYEYSFFYPIYRCLTKIFYRAFN